MGKPDAGSGEESLLLLLPPLLLASKGARSTGTGARRRLGVADTGLRGANRGHGALTGAPLDFARLQRNARSSLGYTIAASHVTSQEDPLHVERLERQISNAAACALCVSAARIYHERAIMNAPGKYMMLREFASTLAF